jgi:hypothetical protein
VFLKLRQRDKAGRQRQFVVAFFFIDPRPCSCDGSLTRIVFLRERFKVDESLRPGTLSPNRHKDGSSAVVAVIGPRRLVDERVSLEAVL